MMFSYFPYAAAFSSGEDGSVRINLALIGVALVVAPFVFVTLAFVSVNPRAPRGVMQSMALLLPIALGVGLASPILGATAAFGVGGTLCLRNPGHDGTYKRRIWVTVFTVLYTLALLVFITPAGVFSGGVLPFLMLGFADEYTEWKATRDGQSSPSGSNPG